MAGREGRFSARIRASSLADRPTGTGASSCECRPAGEEYGLWPSASVDTIAGTQDCGCCHPDPVTGSPRIISGLLGTKGVISPPGAISMTPLENAKHPPVVLYLRRYHMDPMIAAPSSKRAVTVLMTDLATTPTCDFFDCEIVAVVLNWISLTGILRRMVSQPWKKAF